MCRTFEVDPKTVRRYGKALREGDPVELIRVLAGRSAGRKRTLAVDKFAHLRWPSLVAQGSYGAVARLLEEIESVFELTISRSALKDLIRELKAGKPPAEESSPASPLADPVSDEPVATTRSDPPDPLPEIRETGRQGSAPGTEATVPNFTENQAMAAAQPPTPPGNIAHQSPFFPRDPAAALYWCDHAGVLIFATALASVSKVSVTAPTILAQWLSALWLGAQNIEQTKFLNWADLELILGGVVRFPTPQREQLKTLAADPGLIDGLWRFNQQNLGAAVGTDFYFDPHTKLYTGEQNLLKGWCPRIRFADKVLHSDFIHSAQGAPIYLETTDNFADLRQLFGGVITRARQALQWPADTVPTFILDRGIYEQEVLKPSLEIPVFT